MDTFSYLKKGICRNCESYVMFAYSKRLETGLESKKCLNCGQVYQRDNKWKKKEEKKDD